MSVRAWWLLLALLTLVTLARVATTHRVFSPTIDESWHVIAGYDLLTKGIYTTDLEHPPLARVFFGLAFVHVPEPPPNKDGQQRGNSLLAYEGRITANIARARIGNLVFLALGIVSVALWARHVLSPIGGLLAALFFASLPPVLGHAGLATTDMAVTAMLALALYALTLFLERASWPRTLFLGLAIAAGMLAKYSFLLYFPAAALVLCIARRKIPSAKIFASALLAAICIWGAYGFTFGTIANADPHASEYATQVFGSDRITRIPIPAPLYAMGAIEVKHHDLGGHRSFLLGEIRENGWWYYFPVALFFKTPIAFLILAIAGCRRRTLDLALIAAAFLAVAMTSHLNLGIRHVLPIYAPLSILAAYGATQLQRIASVALLAWLVVGSALAHPDYIPWFNAFAGRHPERVLSDSNLDWGQDLFRLGRYARAQHIEFLTISVATTARLEDLHLPPHKILEVSEPLHGWVAVSEFNLTFGRALGDDVGAWIDRTFPDSRPYRRIGKTIRLYHFD
ncbi:MAG TPA: glycosyltransferase family 39 protein [Thermoanaerobaculia bacterium]|nr:glycosyltransferase family 39 protein [Thermoanaerobaculia bacterium]